VPVLYLASVLILKCAARGLAAPALDDSGTTAVCFPVSQSVHRTYVSRSRLCDFVGIACAVCLPLGLVMRYSITHWFNLVGGSRAGGVSSACCYVGYGAIFLGGTV
jgi:hypothetical protein